MTGAAQVTAAARKGRVAPVTIFAGEERWFAEEGVGAIRQAFLGEEEPEGYLAFSAKRNDNDSEGTSLPDALDEGRTVPMFGGRKLVVWRGSGLEEGDLAALKEVAGTPPSRARFVIVLASLKKTEATGLAKAGVTVAECRKLYDTPWPGRPEFDTPLDRFAVERARVHGLWMNLRVAHVLTGAVGNDLAAIDAALAKLALLLDRPGGVQEDDLAPVLPGGRGFNSFALGEAVYGGDVAEAFRVVRNAFREGVEDQFGHRTRVPGTVAGRLFWSVGFQLDKVYSAARLFAEGKSEGEVIAALSGGKQNPAVIRAAGNARRFTLEELLNHYVLIEEADASTRSALPPEIVVSILVTRLVKASDA